MKSFSDEKSKQDKTYDKGARIDRTHKLVLQILYKDCESSLEALLTRNGSNTIHVNNLQKLMTEIISVNGLNPYVYVSFMKGNRLLTI